MAAEKKVAVAENQKKMAEDATKDSADAGASGDAQKKDPNFKPAPAPAPKPKDKN